MDITINTEELDRIIRDCDMNAVQIINRMGFEIEADSKQRAAVDTGAMRNSGFTDAATQDDKTVTVGYTVEYAPYQEFGTYKMAAHPFLTPAVEKILNKFNSGDTWRELCA